MLQGGFGPNAFGGAFQAAEGMPALAHDAQHDVVAAMVEWVEEGKAPTSFIGASWKNNNASEGLQFTRPICQVCHETLPLKSTGC